MPSRLSPLRLPVRTESGRALGHVVDVDVDPETHAVVMYHIKTSRLVPDLVKSPLMVAPSQVVAMTEREMVVEDAVDREKTPAPQPS